MQSGAIDCDVHPAVPNIAALTPFMEPYWREQVSVRGTDGLDLSSYPLHAPDSARADWRVAGQKPGTDLAGIAASRAGRVRQPHRHLQRPVWRARSVQPAFRDRGSPAPPMTGLPPPGWTASPGCAAPSPSRRRIPDGAVAEIERRAADGRFVQVMLLASGDAPLGQPAFWPIYAAAERHGLPVGVHAGSTYRHAVTGNGWPSYHLEDVVVRAQAFQGQLLSLLHEGVFIKFPALRFVMIEAGFTWLPNFLWRANRTWRGVRAEVPWIDRPPAELFRERVRFTLQPGDAPPDAASMERVLDQIGSEDMLLFSTDWPHWQFDGDDPFPPGFSPERRRRVMIDNPLATYPSLQQVMA